MAEDDGYSKDGTLDYKGNPANREKTGTWKACPFILGNEFCERLAYYGMSTNLVIYFKERLNQHSATASKNVSNWSGTCYITPLIGAFLADAYLGRYWTIAVFSIIYVMGMTLLTLSASVPAISPTCEGKDNCHATEWQSVICFAALYLIALGTGGIKPCVSSYGADQFDDADETEKKHKSSFFNWFYLGSIIPQNKPSKQAEVRHLIRRFELSIFAAVEVKIRVEDVDRISGLCSPDSCWENYSFFENHSSKSRIMILWDPRVCGVKILSADDQLVVCEVVWRNYTFRVAFLYVFNCPGDRKSLWDNLIGKVSENQFPWAVCGDFNCILTAEEKINGSPVSEGDTRELRRVLDSSDLEDIDASGCRFTWSNKQSNGDRIWCKLDRILINTTFREVFQEASGFFPEPGISDHSPAIVRTIPRRRKRPWFRFQSFWGVTDEFKGSLVRNWRRYCSNLAHFQSNLKILKNCLKRDMLEHRKDMNKRVDETRLILENIQKRVQDNPCDNNLLQEELRCAAEFRKILKYQFIYNCQRARINWAREGDLNSAYFNNIVKGRRSQNKINSVRMQNGYISFDEEVIKEDFVGYFKSLFSKRSRSQPVDSTLFEGGNKVSPAQCVELVREVSFNEVGKVIKELANNKAAGPDGFNAEFYKASWQICGRDLVRAVSQFFKDGHMPSGTNACYIALIPKGPYSSSPQDFRPISCCNVLYKIISSIITNRLKGVLSELVGDSQSAFISGRNIMHNICLAQGIVTGYNRKNTSKRCIMKIDIRKAYDMVDWDFLESILHRFGFPRKFIQWIMACVTTAKFSVLINGELVDYFGSSRGLRQGDPLSPFLFTLVMEVLSRRLGRMSLDRNFSFHPRCKKANITHLMFADDLLIAVKPSMESVDCIKRALDDFSGWSGLEINASKSCIYFGGYPVEMQRMVAARMGLSIGKLPFLYLGVPLDANKLKVSMFDPIIDKMCGKIRSWSAKCLSYAGRLVLVKHVLSSICSYWMRCCLMPKGVLKKITSICRNYLWSGNASAKRNLVAWKTVCLDKDMGGLGIKDLEKQNKALVLAHIWDVCSRKESLWIKWMHHYFFGNSDFWTLEIKQHHPWMLKELLRMRDEARKCVEVSNSGALTWKGSGTPYNTKETYKLLNVPSQKPRWTNIIWNRISPPKHSFCSWLAVIDRLPMAVRVRDDALDPTCSWCLEAVETIEHLMFSCPRMRVLIPSINRLGYSFQCGSWDQLFGQIESMTWRSKSEREALFFVINAAIYETWRNRNARLFRNEFLEDTEIVERVEKMLRLRRDLMKHKCKGEAG